MSDTIGKFEILGRLGEGAMGTVYRARDRDLDREVALKTVSPAVLARPDALPRFRREARAAARLQHPNIVTVYELGEVEGRPFIAMELLEGIDLAKALRQRDRYSSGALLRIVADVCRALDFAHKKGVVHRDVKPGNIRVLNDGSVKLVDFGIARLADSHMTRTGMILGTPVYIAPEVLKTGRADHRSDMWSAGVILYQVLSGRRPYEGDSIATLAYKVVHDPPDPLPPEVPAPLCSVTERALQKDPAARFRDLAEMALAVEVAAGLSGPLQSSLGAEERMAQLGASLDDARRRLEDRDLEGALAAARRAQALEPSSPDVLRLIDVIESRLDAPDVSAEATPPVAVVDRGAPTTLAEVPPVAGAQRQPGPPTPPAGTQGLGERLRAQGAGALREAGTFGEPPGAQMARLSPDGRLLAVAGADGAVRLWDPVSRTCRSVLRTDVHRRSGREAVASALAFSPDGGLIASGHVDGLARLWHTDSGQEYPVRLRHDGGVPALDFSPDAAVLATGCTDGDLRLWDVRAATEGEARRSLQRQPATVTALRYSASGTRLATAHANRVLRVVEGGNHRLLATLRGHTDVVTLMDFRDELLLTAARDRTLRLFDVAERAERLCVRLRSAALGVAPVDAGRLLAVVTGDNAVHLLDAETGGELATLWGAAGESFVSVAAPGPGPSLLVALADGRLRAWESAG